MLRTNSKKAIQNTRNYIMRNFDGESYGIKNPDPESFEKTAEIIMHVFYSEMVKFDKRNLSYQQLFIEWLSGLPSIIDSLYY